MTRISVVVPSYNHARFIPQCLNSVLAQSFEDWEMVVVDDGSSDGSIELWKECSDPRVRFYSNETNLGTYGTLNRAVSLAKTEMIAVLNSDDWWEPTKLEAQWRALEANPEAPFCYTRGWLPDENGEFSPKDDNYDTWPPEPNLDITPYILDFNRLMASSVIFRKKWATFDEGLQYSGDWIASLRAAYAHPPIGIIEPLTFWRQHGENTSKRFREVTLEEVRVRRSIVHGRSNWRLPRVDPALVNERVGQCAFHLCALEMLWGCVGESRRTAKLALSLLHNKKMGIRRMAVTLLPRQVAVKRMFPNRPMDFLRSEVDSLAPIEFNLPEPEGGRPEG